MKSFVPLIFAFAALSGPARGDVQKVEFGDRAGVPFSGGSSEISIADPILERGQNFRLKVRFEAGEQGGTFFNVFLKKGGWGLPASLVVFDSEKNYVGDVPEYTGGPRKGLSLEDWTTLPGNAGAETILGGKAGQLGPLSDPLPAGTYYVQLIYKKSLLTPRPDSLQEMWKSLDHRDNSELFRSNALRIELVDRREAARPSFDEIVNLNQFPYDVERLYQQIEKLVHRDYPLATYYHLGSEIHFEYKTRPFIVLPRNLVGQPSAPIAVRGPDAGGVDCFIHIRAGQPRVRQQLLFEVDGPLPRDEGGEFDTFPLGCYSGKLNAYTDGQIKLPSNTAPTFRHDLTALLDRFDELVDKMQEKSN